MRKLLIGAIAVALACSAAGIAACTTEPEKHTHTFDTVEWEYNSISHWHGCTGCDEGKQDEAVHRGGTATHDSKPVCEVCGQEYGKALGHTFSQTGTVKKEATCSEEGIMTYKCTECDEEKEEPIPTIAHKYGGWSDDGKNHWRECTVCHEGKKNEGAHTGGTALRDKRAVCTVCGLEYGEADPTSVEMKYLNNVSGKFAQNTLNNVKSVNQNSMTIVKDSEFVYGTLKADIEINGSATDNGIVFGVTNPDGLESFWENNVSYYFFFLTGRGSAYLGKVDGGWQLLKEVSIKNYNSAVKHELKVVRTATSVKCYVDGTEYISHSEMQYLAGTGYGFRAGGTNIVYSNLFCESGGEFVTPSADEYMTVISGGVNATDVSVKTSSDNTLALWKGKELAEGTYSAVFRGVNNGNSGLVFNYSDDGYYTFYVNRAAQRVEFAKVTGGNKTVLYGNYLSAGYNESASFPIKVVIKDGKAYCSFFNTLYTVQELDLGGTGAGIFAAKSGAEIIGAEITSEAVVEKCDTLIFGHSYTEMWDDWKDDFSTIDGLGTVANIGIGGSIADHWYGFKDSIVEFAPKQGIYWIGINDLSGGMSPYLVIESIRDTLTYVKGKIPEFKVVLLSVNYCNARENIRNEIHETNILMQRLCAEYDWISYAEVETLFCNDGTYPDKEWFKDDLHPTAEAYTEKVIPVIIKALNGEDQPALTPDMEAEILQVAKDLKFCQLADYTIDGFRNEEWEEAESIYNAAAAAINACTTKAELEALDLTVYIEQLDAIKHNGDYIYESLVNNSGCASWETPEFTSAVNSGTNGYFNINGGAGHRIVSTVEYADMSFRFGLSDITGEFPTVGILFRATQNSTLGIDGYYINIVTEPNFIQVWYFNNGYGTTNGVIEYMGGWVFPGEVENTEFRAIVNGGMIYIYTEETYLAKGEKAYGCAVDLTANSKRQLYTSGGIGILNWSDASGKLFLSDISTAQAHVSSSEYLAQLKAAKKAELSAYDRLAYRDGEWAEVESVYAEAIDAIDSCTTVKQIRELDLPGYIARLKAVKTNTQISFEEFTSNINTSAYEVPDFTQALDTSTDGVYNIVNSGYRILNTVQYSNVTFTFRLSDNSGNVGLGGVLFNASRTPNFGLNGYLINYVTEPNYIQILWLDDCFPQLPGTDRNVYIGGWVFPGNVANTLFRAVVTSDTVYIYTEADYAVFGDKATGIAVKLDGSTMGQNLTVYGKGAIGVFNRGDTSFKLTIADIRSSDCSGLGGLTSSFVSAITDKNGCKTFNPDGINATGNGSFSVSGESYVLDTSKTVKDFTMTVKLSDCGGEVSSAGILFRAKPSETSDGLDGYSFNFSNAGGNRFIQIFYMKDCYATNASPRCDYLDGWVVSETGSAFNVTDRDFYITLRGNVLIIGAEDFNVTNNFNTWIINLGGRDNMPIYGEGGLGVYSWQQGFGGTITVKDITEI